MPTKFENQRLRNESGDSSMSTDTVSKYIPHPPDGGWGWVIVFASFVNHIIVDGIAFTFGVFYSEFLREFGAGKGQTALVGSLLTGFYLMAGPFASALVNKFGCRPVCIFGSILSCLSFALSTLSTNITMLMLTYGVLGGFGLGLIYLPSIISVSYYFERRRAFATGIAVCGAGVGCFMFAPAGSIMMSYFDWKNGLFIVAGMVLNSCICGMVMRPLEPAYKQRPRAKNVIDRLKERMRFRRMDSDNGRSGESERMLAALHKARAQRERALRDDDSETGSAFSSFRLSRNGSLANTGNFMRKDSRPSSLIQNVTFSNSQVLGQQASASSSSPGSVAHSVSGQIPATTPTTSVPQIRIEHDEEALYGTENNKKRNSKPLLPNEVKSLTTEAELLYSSWQTSEQQKAAKSGDITAAGRKCISSSDMWGNLVSRQGHKLKRPQGVEKEDYSRPLYRQDIFYSGSIIHIPQFRSQQITDQTYTVSVTHIPSDRDEISSMAKPSCWDHVPLPKVIKDILRQMLDISLFREPLFLITCLGEIFGFIGLFIPFVYLAERAVNLGIEDTHAAFLLSVIGITNTFGRILSGWLADFPWVNSLLLHNLALICGGIACMLNSFATTYAAMCVFSAFFGLCVAAYISLTSIILCDLVGLERLTSAFGLLTLTRGISSIAGPPIAGLVFDLTNDHDISFHIGGAMLLLSGLIFCLLHLSYFQAQYSVQKQKPKQLMADQAPCAAASTIKYQDNRAQSSSSLPKISHEPNSIVSKAQQGVKLTKVV